METRRELKASEGNRRVILESLELIDPVNGYRAAELTVEVMPKGTDPGHRVSIRLFKHKLKALASMLNGAAAEI